MLGLTGATCLVVAGVAILQHQRGNYGHALTLCNKVVQSGNTSWHSCMTGRLTRGSC